MKIVSFLFVAVYTVSASNRFHPDYSLAHFKGWKFLQRNKRGLGLIRNYQLVGESFNSAKMKVQKNVAHSRDVSMQLADLRTYFSKSLPRFKKIKSFGVFVVPHQRIRQIQRRINKVSREFTQVQRDMYAANRRKNTIETRYRQLSQWLRFMFSGHVQMKFRNAVNAWMQDIMDWSDELKRESEKVDLGFSTISVQVDRIWKTIERHQRR